MVAVVHDIFHFVLVFFNFDEQFQFKRCYFKVKDAHLAVDFGGVGFAIMPNIQNQLLSWLLKLFR